MRLLELYTTVQGEGPNVGKPTTFIRFAGCNMRCPGWPCDTPYSIDPDIWRHEFEEVSPEGIYERVALLNPKHVCITGGEPMLQPKKEVHDLVELLLRSGYTIDVFTNGSIAYPQRLPLNWTNGLFIIQDWKLDGSGEGGSFLDFREANRKLLRKHDAVKFVVKDNADLMEGRSWMQAWGLYAHRVYFSPAWDLITPAQIVGFIDTYNLDAWLNLQVHKYIWSPTARRI